MNIFERIAADIKQAMKSKNELELLTLRLVRAALKNKEIEVQHELTDDEAVSVIKTMVRQGKDALVDFTAANRTDLIEKQTKEIEILDRYLPAQMAEAEIREICKKIITESGATGPSDAGKVMGAVMKAIAGQADGSVVRDIVQSQLAELSQ